MMGTRETAAERQLHVLVELISDDLRIGAVNDALDLAELARPAGVRFTLCGPLRKEFTEEAVRRGAQTLRASSRIISRRGLPLYAVSVTRWIARIRRLRPDVVHLNYPGYGPSLACAAWLCGIPIVARAGPLVERNPSNRWVAAYTANCPAQADGLLASSLADKVVVTGDLFRPDRVQRTMVPERPLPAKRASVRVLFLGQVVERKGLHVLIEAFARVRLSAELVLCGGDWDAPGYPQRVKALVRAAGLDPYVHFEHHRQDVGAVLRTADVFVLPSLSEARPRSIIEAMSLGVPVVASATGGIPSLVDNHKTGLLVPPGDVDRLAGALDRLIRSAALRAHLGEEGCRHAERECRPDRTALEYVALYRRLAARHGDARAAKSLLARQES